MGRFNRLCLEESNEAKILEEDFLQSLKISRPAQFLGRSLFSFNENIWEHLLFFFMLKFKLFSVQLLSKLNDGIPKSISAENNFYKNHSISSIIVAEYYLALTLRVVPIRI